MRVLGVPVRAHALMPLLALLAARTGAWPEELALVAAAVPHELAHLAAARATGIRVRELELTPFGAAARLESGWTASPTRIALTALAGPAANLLLLSAIGALAYAGGIPGRPAYLLMRANAMLLAVNLLPALPLDGGRALCACVGVWTGSRKAVAALSRAGYALAALLCALAVYMGVREGVWNVALFGAAAYLAACAAREPAQARAAQAEGLAYRRDELRRLGALPVRQLAVPQDTTAAEALRLLRPGRLHVFSLYDDAMRQVGVLGENALLAAIPERADQPLRALAR